MHSGGGGAGGGCGGGCDVCLGVGVGRPLRSRGVVIVRIPLTFTTGWQGLPRRCAEDGGS